MEEEGLTEPNLDLDDPEKLVRESAQESFSWWRPRALPRLNGPAINDLAAHRWFATTVAKPDSDVIRRIQTGKHWRHRDSRALVELPGEGMAYDELLACYHRKVLQVANARMPRYWRRRQAPKDKHTNTVLYEDLVAAGVAAMWEAAIGFDADSGNAFWTAARLPVLGAISDEARLWRRNGSGEGRLDRWLYTHPDASPEEVLEEQARLLKRPIFHTLKEAAEGVQKFWAWGSDPESEWDDEQFPTQQRRYLAEILREWFDCFDPYQLSYSYSDANGMAAPEDSRISYLEIHEHLSLVVDRRSGGLDTGPDVGNASRPKRPQEPLDCTETAVVCFKNGERRVARQKAQPGYHIPVTASLDAVAQKDLEFAKRRWELRTKYGSFATKTYPRWSTKFGVGRAEHENRQILPAYVPITRFTWKVEYRGAEGNVVAELESPSWHCLAPKPCALCEKVRGRGRPHNVALPPLPPPRALDRRHALELRPANPRTESRTAKTRLEIK